MKHNVHIYTLLMLAPCTLCNGQTTLVKATAGRHEKSSAVRFGRVDFSGEWKLNETKSDLGSQFPLCIFGGGDRGRSRIMRIATHDGFLMVDVAGSSSKGELVVRREQITFGDQVPAPTFVGTPREMSIAKWSDDGQTMVVRSARSLDASNENVDFNVTEVWSLSVDGKSITVSVHSSSEFGERAMKLVYDRQKAADYRF